MAVRAPATKDMDANGIGEIVSRSLFEDGTPGEEGKP